MLRKLLLEPKRLYTHPGYRLLVRSEKMEKWKEAKIESIHNIPWIQTVPVIVYGKDSGYQAVVNSETKDTISIMSGIYQPVQHRDVYDRISKLNDYTICSASIYRRGRMLMVEVEETSPQKQELLPGDYFTNRIRLFNSYDGTTALSVQSWGIRLVCKNGMVAPVQIHSYHKVHAFDNIDLAEVEKHIELAKELWGESKELIQAASKTEINVAEVMEKFNFLPKKYTKIVLEHLGPKETVYDTWNELTRTVTHDMGTSISTNNLVETQKEVNKIFQLVEVPK